MEDLAQIKKDKVKQEDEKEEVPVGEHEDGAQEKKKKKKKKKNKNKAEDEENLEDVIDAQFGEDADGKKTENKPPQKQEKKEEEKKQSELDDDAKAGTTAGADDGDEEDDGPEGEGGAKKKKKRRRKKGGAGGGGGNVIYAPREQENVEIRKLGNWSAGDWKQTIDYSIPVSQQFPSGIYNEGEWMDHPGDFNTMRITGAEFRDRDKLHASKVNDLRKAAECHRQVRKMAQTYMRPGVKLIDICERIEETNRRLVEANGIQQGIGFPTGCSINDCAAHYTPNPGDDTVLKYDDVMKIDFGTQVNGHIIDCAFTVAFNPMFDPLLQAVKEATNEGIKTAGIDVRLCDIGEAIQEVMESHEVTIGNTTFPVKSVQNLCGHSIGPYTIHAGKSVPIVKGGKETKMEEGELFAIETFGSTGKGSIFNAPDCSHYMINQDCGDVAIRNPKAKALLAEIKNKFHTLAFCRRWLEPTFPRHFAPLKQLVDSGVVTAYPPLNDISGCHVAQYEHTIFLHPTRKEVLSRGDDY